MTVVNHTFAIQWNITKFIVCQKPFLISAFLTAFEDKALTHGLLCLYGCMDPDQAGNYSPMDDIRYSRNRVIYVSCPCALVLALRNVRNIFILQMALVVLTIITKLKLRWISVTD